MTINPLSNTGIFQLKKPKDLVAKARHDLARMRSDPNDAYAAFDFFITVRHLPEWLHPKDHSKIEQLFLQHIELRICRHLADGAKHFEVTNPKHKQVTNTWFSSGAWGNSWAKGVWKPGTWGHGLFVTLDPRDTQTQTLGAKVSALYLAEKVMEVVEKIVI